MNPFVASCLFTAILSLLLGLFTVFKNFKEKVNRLWFLTTLSVFMWTVGLAGAVISNNEDAALFWQKILYVGTILIPIFFFNFCVSFLKKDHQSKILLIIGYSLSAIFLFLLFFTKLFLVKIAARINFGYWPVETGYLYWLFLVYFLFYAAYSIILLKLESKKYSGTTRKQIDYIFYTALVGYVGGSTNFLLDFNLGIYPFGNYFVALYAIFMTYAIFKHHLFNIKVITAEMLTFTIWAFVLLRTLLAESLRERIIDGSLLVLVILFGLILIRSVLKEVEQKEKLETLTKELQTTNEQLKQLNKQKSEFLSFASHQVKSPMAVVKGFAQLISDGTYGAIPEKVKETAQKIKNSADKMIALVNNLLDLRKIEEGKMEFTFTEVNINELVGGIVEGLKPLAQDKKLELSFAGLLSEIKIKADPQKFSQVIQNLVDNAIKYTPEGWVKVEIKEKPKQGDILISVSDSGMGIAPELQSHLFEQFSRDSLAAKEIQGTGLGLYIAKQIIEAHHGLIWAESKGRNKGSTFYIEIPVK